MSSSVVHSLVHWIHKLGVRPLRTVRPAQFHLLGAALARDSVESATTSSRPRSRSITDRTASDARHRRAIPRSS